MHVDEYLKRINCNDGLHVDLDTLIKLHESHVIHVPFENLDIQSNIQIVLEENHLFRKVVGHRRGGFCYELNYLFWSLLKHIGFDAWIISARIFDEGVEGPEFDHMAVIVDLHGVEWLVDVGFGDLFVRPLEIGGENVQFDGRHYFSITKTAGQSYVLSMAVNSAIPTMKYTFQNKPRKVEDFFPQCIWKQSSPNSYFVKNKVVTLATPNGRKTLFNAKFIEKNNGVRKEREVQNLREEEQLLKNEFGLVRT